MVLKVAFCKMLKKLEGLRMFFFVCKALRSFVKGVGCWAKRFRVSGVCRD